ncbi:MAG TPA: ABC transporter permease [Bryobacteraceae bacterium]|nr:ABC transporter permease [Bryobacteraceae bacterium]
MEGILKDVTQSLRLLRRSPGFAIPAVAALALGIGANVAIFSVVNAVLLKPVAAPHPENVVVFLATNRGGTGAIASDIKFNLWRQQTSVFEEVSGYHTGMLNVTGIDEPQPAAGAFVTVDYFRLFGLSTEQGRTFTAEEERPHGAKVVIVSHSFWRKMLGGDPRIVGKVISLDNESYQVIGILPAGIRLAEGDPPDLWFPFPIDPNSNNQVHYFRALGRIKAGVSLDQANAQMRLTTQEFRRRYPNALSTSREDVFSVQPLRDFLAQDVRSSLLLLAGAVGLVWLIACANVANLLLIRAAGRRREIATRIAVGAPRWRIVRQLLTESVLLSAAGAAGGLALGAGGIRALLAANPVDLPRLGVKGANVAMDWRVLAFTVLTALATGILFGLIPALEASRADLSGVLKEGGGRTGGSSRQNRARSLLAVGEMSLAIVLSIGAALFIRTLVALRSVNPGFDPHQAVAARVTLDPQLARLPGVDDIAADVFRRLQRLPAVESAALTQLLPLEGGFNSLTIVILGRPLTGLAHGNARWMTVSPEYFDVLKIPLLRGRAFTEGDRRGAPAVAVINQAMARQFWPTGDPLNDRLVIGRGLGQNFDEPPRQVVGIVGDVHEDALGMQPLPAVFVPLAQRPNTRAYTMWAVLRTHGQSPALDEEIRGELRRATGVPVPPLRSMREVLVQSTAEQKFQMLLMSIFGGLAVFLAAVGIYGLMAYSVEQRTLEIGIRMALGAQSGDVRNMVVLQGIRLALIGVALGLAAAFGLTRFVRSFLFGVNRLDPLAFLAVPVILSGVAIVAVWLPARRASRVDPIHALRREC